MTAKVGIHFRQGGRGSQNQARCQECRWSARPTSDYQAADRQADRHNAKEHQA